MDTLLAEWFYTKIYGVFEFYLRWFSLGRGGGGGGGGGGSEKQLKNKIVYLFPYILFLVR